MKKFFLSLMAAIMLLSLFAPVAFAGSGDNPSLQIKKQLAQVKRATAKYQDYRKALADGFVNTETCVSDPNSGAMGVHFINFSRVMDPTIKATQPEILLYEPLPDGGYRLVGVEYMFAIGGPDAPIPANPPPAPVLFGQTFNGPMLTHEPGGPPHYDLHVWLWQPNPNGTFAQFNPQVSCPGS